MFETGDVNTGPPNEPKTSTDPIAASANTKSAKHSKYDTGSVLNKRQSIKDSRPKKGILGIRRKNDKSIHKLSDSDSEIEITKAEALNLKKRNIKTENSTENDYYNSISNLRAENSRKDISLQS